MADRSKWAFYARERRARLRREGRCYYCARSVEGSRCKSYCDICREKRIHAFNTKYREKRRVKHKEAQQKLKMEVYNAYGGPICKCCGETEMEFLSIDHINGHQVSNAQRRANVGLFSGNNLYRQLKRQGWPEGIRILCMNCNFAYGHFGYCPHDRKKLRAVI